jgi:hypothetical protein
MSEGLEMEGILGGNTLEENAYHEAGHIVIAASVCLDLKPKGIVIYEVTREVAEGWAFYWEDRPEWESILMAVRAGQVAQLRQFPKSEFRGGQQDVRNFFAIVENNVGPNRGGEFWERITAKVCGLLDTNWPAVVAIAEAVMRSDWISVDSGEHDLAKRKKHLDGDLLVAILRNHAISAQVRR